MIELVWNAPISESKMGRILETTDLRAGQQVLDVGCGCGEVLIRLGERYQVTGRGIDSSEEHIEEARRRARGRVSESAIRFIHADAQSFHVDDASLDLVVCMGATHALASGADAFRGAIARMIPWVAPGGTILVGDGYMRRPAAPEYRMLLGDSLPDEMTHAANVATGQSLGLVPLTAWTSSEDEWDDFEWTYQRIVERRAAEQPDDPAVAEKLARRREWMQAYVQWGRSTLGYGVYLFCEPNS